MRGHENDTINTAKVSLSRINSTVNSDYALNIPTTLLMIPKAEMYSFFENKQVANYKTSFLATYSSTTNQYTFNNIGSLVRYMNENKQNKDWDKVVIIPVTPTYNTSGEMTNLTHDMSISSTKLVGGSENQNGTINITVIYSKFK